MEKRIVYKITNNINNKLYFGITKVGLKKRWIQHKCNSTRKTYHLYRAIIKYGIENFKIEVVKVCNTEEEMYQNEIEFINEYKTNNRLYGYNNSIGGEKSTAGSKRTIEQRKKISDYQKTRVRKPHSEETKSKMRLAAKGRDMSKVYTISAKLNKGRPAKNIAPVYSVDKNGLIKKYQSITEASKFTGILITSICNNLKNKSKKSGGLVWHYQQQN